MDNPSSVEKERPHRSFALGQIYVSPTVGETLSEDEIKASLERHANGDDINDCDRAANDRCPWIQAPLISEYCLP